MYVVSTVNEYNDYNLVDISGNIPTFGGSNQVFCVYDIQSTTCIYYAHYFISFIIPINILAAPITKIDVCYMTDLKWIGDK